MIDKEDQIKLIYNTYLEEYRVLKMEIASNLNSARQTVNLTLIAIGTLIAAIPYIIQSQIIVTFLIAPILFYGLAWTQLRYIFLALDQGAYLREVIIPPIRQALLELSPQHEYDFTKIMSWEMKGKSPLRLRQSRLSKLSFIPIAGAGYGMPFLGVILSLSVYVILASQNTQAISLLEWLLIVGNSIAFIYSVYWGFQAEIQR